VSDGTRGAGSAGECDRSRPQPSAIGRLVLVYGSHFFDTFAKGARFECRYDFPAWPCASSRNLDPRSARRVRHAAIGRTPDGESWQVAARRNCYAPQPGAVLDHFERM
jgi:hypothetical protein